MNKTKLEITATILLICGLVSVFITACKGTSADCSYAKGTLDGPLTEDTAPPRVLEAMERAERLHQYELMSDTTVNVAVSCIGEADTTSTEGFGIVVTKGSPVSQRSSRQP